MNRRRCAAESSAADAAHSDRSRRTLRAATRPVRPPSHAAPRTPTMSAPASRTNGRSSAVNLPASTTNSPVSCASATHAASAPGATSRRRPGPRLSAVSISRPSAPAGAATFVRAAGARLATRSASAYATATTPARSTPPVLAPRTAAAISAARAFGAADPAEANLHERRARRGESGRRALDLPPRRTRRPARRSPGERLRRRRGFRAAPPQGHGAERTGQRILGINHVGAADKRRRRFGCARNADQQSHVRYCIILRLSSAGGRRPAVAAEGEREMKDAVARPLAGRAVLVTGASSGIGRAIALAAARAGADVALTYRSNDSGAQGSRARDSRSRTPRRGDPASI